MTVAPDDSSIDWKKEILSLLRTESSSSAGKEFSVKKLRKQVLLALQLDEDDKTAKKDYKKTMKALEEEAVLSINVDGLVCLEEKGKKEKSKRKRQEKESKKAKKKLKKEKKEKADAEDVESNNNTNNNSSKEEQTPDSEEQEDSESNVPIKKEEVDKGGSCTGNPQGVTRLFLGNLPFTVDETSLQAFLPGLTHIKWITDKETGKFYGSAFVEMETTKSAADAVSKAGSQLMGRPIKINFAAARPGDIWPPSKSVISGGGHDKQQRNTGGQAGGTGTKAMSEKPANCMKLFIGNLSYDIDDDGIIKFFANVDAEVKAVRWLHHKETGDFKGCGFIEFWNTEACEKGAALNGKHLLGRPIRIDWTD